MYKITIQLGWDETVTIDTDDFNKIALIQEFIAEQEANDWGVYDDEYVFTDEDGTTWYYDEEDDTWYEFEEDSEDEDSEDEDEEEEDEEDYS